MNHSGFALTEQMKSRFAVGYEPARSDGTYERSAYPEHGLASGMLYSTVDDLAELLSLFFREGSAGGKQVLGSSSLREMLLPVAVSNDVRRDAQGKPASLWDTGSTIGFSVGPIDGEQIHYKPGGTNGFSSMVYINCPRKLGMAVLMNTQADPFFETFDPLGFGVLRKLTPVVAKSLARRRNQALMEALPSWQKYTGRYVITDTNAVRTLTFSEFDVSIVNQKLVVTVPDTLSGSFVYMKEARLAPYGGKVFHVDMGGGSFKRNFMTFESNQDGSMVLKWRNYVFKRQP